MATLNVKRPPGANPGGRVGLRTAVAFWIAHRGCCFWCGDRMAPLNVTIDHVIERRFGGPDHVSNYVLAHQRCNQSRSNGVQPAPPLTPRQDAKLHYIRASMRWLLSPSRKLGEAVRSSTLADVAEQRQREGPP